MSGFGAVQGNVTTNLYSSFDLASSFSSIVGLFALVGVIICVLLLPKHLRRLIVGYGLLVVVTVIAFIFWAIVKSIEPIGNFLFYDVFKWIGDFIIGYWTYILLSIPLAYAAGLVSEKYIFPEEVEGRRKK